MYANYQKYDKDIKETVLKIVKSKEFDSYRDGFSLVVALITSAYKAAYTIATEAKGSKAETAKEILKFLIDMQIDQ